MSLSRALGSIASDFACCSFAVPELCAVAQPVCPAQVMAMRGLTVFISDLRNCSNKEQEAKRVEKEMAHIRSKFTSDTHMNGYNRKKYVWKILYMYMLGYEVDFGHMEAVNLISSNRYSEKSVGYSW